MLASDTIITLIEKSKPVYVGLYLKELISFDVYCKTFRSRILLAAPHISMEIGEERERKREYEAMNLRPGEFKTPLWLTKMLKQRHQLYPLFS